MIDKDKIVLEIYHVIGRILSGTIVFAIGKYVFLLWS
jgi:hypothetical protein